MALNDVPPLGSAELEALLMSPLDDAPVPYDMLSQPSADWLLDPSPAGRNSSLPGAQVAGFGVGAPADGSSTLPSALPAALPDMFLDPFLGSMADFVPMPALGADTFIPPPLQASSGDGSGSHDGSGPTSSGGGGGAGGATSAATAAIAPRKPRSTGSRKDLTEDQLERIRAKNRRAQNRYREKQKAKAAATEQEYYDTAAQLERLRLENSRLQEQQTTMQKVLSVRESAMELLQSSKAADERNEQQGSNTMLLSCGCASAETCTCKQLPPTAGEVAKALCPVNDDLHPAEGGTQCPFTGLTLSQIAELQRTPPEVLKQKWKGLAQRLEVILQQQEAAEASPDPSLAARAEQLGVQLQETLYEGQAFCFEHAIYQPTSVQKLFAAALDDGRSQISSGDMNHWEAVAAAIQPSPEQLERMAAARAKFLQRIEEVCTERRQIFERLQSIQVPTTLKAMQQATASWLQVHEATAELSANMTQEHCVCMSFVRDAFGYVLSPRQKAVAIVRSYPYFPDMYSITTALLQATDALPAGGERRLLTGGTAVAVGAESAATTTTAAAAAVGVAVRVS